LLLALLELLETRLLRPYPLLLAHLLLPLLEPLLLPPLLL